MYKKFATILGVMLLLSIPVIATVGFVYTSGLNEGVQSVFAFGDSGGGDNGGNDSGGGDNGGNDSGGGDNGGNDSGGGDNGGTGDTGGGTEQPPAPVLPPPVVDIVGSYPVGTSWQQGPITIQKGDGVALGWVSSFADFCTVVSSPNIGTWTGTNQGPNPPLVIPQVDTTFTITCTNTVGSATDSLIIIPVTPPPPPPVCVAPTISGSLSATVGINTPFSYNISAEGTAPITLEASNLPNGLSFSNGVISGTPTQAGTFNIVLIVRNDCGKVQKTLVLTVTPPVCIAPKLPIFANVEASLNQPFTYPISVIEATSPVSVTVTGLPQGLTYAASKISGTPKESGTFTVTVKAKNSCGEDIKQFKITVKVPVCVPGIPSITSPLSSIGKVGQNFSYQITATNIPTVVSASSLPPGLSLSGGVISGKPLQKGTFNVSISAKNDCGMDTEILVIVIEEEPPQVCVSPIPSITSGNATGKVGQYFEYQFTFQNGDAINLFRVNGDIPDGLTHQGDRIWGVPSEAGTFTLEAVAEYKCGEVKKTITITILPTTTHQPPVCTLTASDTWIYPGESVKLTWTSSNAQSVNFNPSLGTNALNGYKDVSPSVTTTYKGTWTGQGGSVNCEVKVNVKKPAPVCTLTASKTSIKKGEVITLSWTSENATSASMNQGVGSISLNGSRSVSPIADATFVATFSGAGGEETCEVPITVTEVPEIPQCPFYQNDHNIVIKFDGDYIVANSSESNAHTNTVGVNVPAGTYKVKLASYDNHSGKPVQNQPGEQWYLRLMKGDYSIVAQSLSIADLPADEDFFVEEVQNNFVVPHNAYKALGAHTHYPDSNPNSITPICAELKPVEPPQCIPGVPSVTSSAHANGVVGQSFSYTITSDKDVTSVTATPLPPGITLNGNVLSGTFTQAGTFNVTIRVANECGYDTKILTIVVTSPSCDLPAPKIENEDLDVEGTIGVAFSYEIETSGTVAEISVDDLPEGLSLVGNKIQGVPTEKGTFNVYVSVSNACGADMETIEIKINDAPVCTPGIPVVNSATSVAGTVGVPLVYTITALNSPNSFSVATSTLPPGLVWSGAVISGIPTSTGTFKVTLEAENHCGKGPAEVTIIITSPGGQCTIPTPTITSLDSVSGTIGSAFSYQIAASSTVNSYSVTNLPGGLTLSTSTGLISGTPTETGTFTITVSALNQCGSGSKNVVISITGGGGGCTSGCGGGGGGYPPTVTLTRATSTPLAAAIISLSQVPYTGFGDVFGTIAFMLLVFMASIALAYMSIYRENPLKALSLISPIKGNIRSKITSYISPATHSIATDWDTYTVSEKSSSSVAPIEEVVEAWKETAQITENSSQVTIAPMLRQESEEKNNEIKGVVEDITKSLSSMQATSRKENEMSEVVNTLANVSLEREIDELARNEGVLLSEGVASLVLTAADQDLSKAREVLHQLTDVAREWYPTSSDSYLVLTAPKARKILFSTYVTMIPLFIRWIAEGESKKIFGLLRILNQQGHSISDFVGKVVAELDAVYRFKTEGVGNPDQFALEITNSWKRGTLEAIIAALVSGVDESYGSQYVAAKLALTKALDIGRVEREEIR